MAGCAMGVGVGFEIGFGGVKGATGIEAGVGTAGVGVVVVGAGEKGVGVAGFGAGLYDG